MVRVRADILKVIFLCCENLTFKNFVQENLQIIPKMIHKGVKISKSFVKLVKVHDFLVHMYASQDFAQTQ